MYFSPLNCRVEPKLITSGLQRAQCLGYIAITWVWDYYFCLKTFKSQTLAVVDMWDFSPISVSLFCLEGLEPQTLNPKP